MMNESSKYDDIIMLPHHKSKTHHHMSLSDRAAQFAPFAALTGFEETLDEVDRITENKKELSDDEKEIINQKLLMILDNLPNRIESEITYFEKDQKKSGGHYLTIRSSIKRIDEINHQLIMSNNKRILIDDILNIKCSLFKE